MAKVIKIDGFYGEGGGKLKISARGPLRRSSRFDESKTRRVSEASGSRLWSGKNEK